MAKYAARMLWQYRPQEGSVSKQRRICEERVVVFDADSGHEAYEKIDAYGRASQLHSTVRNEPDVKIHFEFIGVIDLILLSDWSENDEFQEVWYELYDRLRPMERKDKLIPKKEELREFYVGKLPRRGKTRLKW